MNMDTNDWFNHRLAKQYARLKNKEVGIVDFSTRLENAEERTERLLKRQNNNDLVRMKATLQLVERRTFYTARNVVVTNVCLLVIVLLLVIHVFH